MNLTDAGAATILSTTISTAITAFVTLKINKSDSKKNLDKQLDEILKIAIQYPYLENQVFANSWANNKNSQDENYLRYDNYCNLIFNYLSRFCSHYKFDKAKIENQLNIRDWIRVHQQCWENPSTPYENADGYSDKFKKFINQYLK
jgi:hypothetical protein